MSSKGEMSGFRVCTEVYRQNTTVPKKYYIYLNKSKWSHIRDVRDHIKNIFELGNDFEIYIDGMLLPGNETIDLIQQEDTLVVKILRDTNQITQEDSDIEIIGSFSNSKQPKLKKKKSRVNKDFDEVNESSELLERKRAILSALKSISSSSYVNEENATSNENSVTLLNDDVLDDDGFPPPKKKRKRKHKKKVKLVVDDSCVGNSEEIDINCSTDDKPDTENISNTYNLTKKETLQKHTYFNDGIDEPHSSKEAHSTPVRETASNDIRTRLTQLANRPRSEKVFERIKTSTEGNISQRGDICLDNSQDKNVSSFEIDESAQVIEKPRVGDTITFTKLKIGDNYCPEPSGTIIGKILRVQSSQDSPDQLRVAMEILKGSEEFLVPEGKFSLEQENDVLNGIPQIYIAEIYWHEVIEPRLLRQ